MGAFLPIVVQLPIIWALYSTLRNFGYGGSTAATHWFLGYDLTRTYGFTSPYHLLLPILSALTSYLQTRVTNPNIAYPTQKKMLYIMPLISAYISATVPAGLALYW